MAYWEWQESYATTVSEFDAHHQHLMSLLNNLYDNVFSCTDVSKKQRLIGESLTELADYTQYHFTAEEELMRQYAYPDFTSHKQQHDHFKQQVAELIGQHRDGTLTLSHPVLTLLIEWITVHILETDKKYGPFFSAKTRE